LREYDIDQRDLCDVLNHTTKTQIYQTISLQKKNNSEDKEEGK
jgi:hypothetical protein